ncbi:DUF6221 family protein [Streptomyces sp. NPDC054847]
MTAQGEDILAWLDRAITKRQCMATEAADEYGADWYYDDGFVLARREDDMVATGSQDFLERPQGQLIATNDPESVLRRCAADRQLLKLHARTMHSCPATDETGYLDEWTQFRHEDLCPVVQLLADSYGWAAPQTSASTPAQTPPSDGDQMT